MRKSFRFFVSNNSAATSTSFAAICTAALSKTPQTAKEHYWRALALMREHRNDVRKLTEALTHVEKAAELDEKGYKFLLDQKTRQIERMIDKASQSKPKAG